MNVYVVTKTAGDYVAGQRVAGLEVGKDGFARIVLSADAAAYELMLGSIREIDASPATIVAPARERKGAAQAEAKVEA